MYKINPRTAESNDKQTHRCKLFHRTAPWAQLQLFTSSRFCQIKALVKGVSKNTESSTLSWWQDNLREITKHALKRPQKKLQKKRVLSISLLNKWWNFWIFLLVPLFSTFYPIYLFIYLFLVHFYFLLWLFHMEGQRSLLLLPNEAQRTHLAHQIECSLYLFHSFHISMWLKVTERGNSVKKHLEGDWTKLRSVTLKVDQPGFFFKNFLLMQVATATLDIRCRLVAANTMPQCLTIQCR